MIKFNLSAALFAVTMILLTACEDSKTTPEQEPGQNDSTICETCEKDPCECQPMSPEVAAIVIDGEFDDWAALDTSCVAVATCADTPYKTALKTLRVYADSDYINIYFEVDEDEIMGEAPLDIYINADNSENFASQYWSNQAGVDYLIEGYYYKGEDPEICSFDAALYGYLGTEEIFEWSWDPESDPLVPKGIGLTSGAGNVAKYELRIVRELLKDVELSNPFGLGLTVSSQEWNAIGILPNGNVSDYDPYGAVKFLEVKIN